jgi:hypothetical protein
MAAKWTNEEIDFVIKNHFTMNNFELAQALGRTVRGVGTKRYKIINIDHKIGENNRGWKGYKTISGKEFSNIKNNAKNRDIPFYITIKDIYDLYESQDYKCIYTGLDLCFDNGSKGRINYSYALGNASIDRIDSLLPYQKNNIQIVHKHVNKMKYNYTEEEFFDWIRLIINPKINYISDDIVVRKHNNQFTGYGNLSGKFWSQILYNANKRKISMNITVADAWCLFCKQNGCCIYTGIPLSMPISSTKVIAGTASLDRIDSKIGYTLANIQWIHKDLSSIKWDFLDSYFREMCQLVYNHRGL